MIVHAEINAEKKMHLGTLHTMHMCANLKSHTHYCFTCVLDLYLNAQIVVHVDDTGT